MRGESRRVANVVLYWVHDSPISNREALMRRYDHQFSPDRTYRYTLWRWWDEMFNDSYVQWIGLNPSTADEVQLDPTVTRIIDYSKTFGFGGFCMTNLFGYRETKRKEMMRHADPIGKDNDKWLYDTAKGASMIIAAWGCDGVHRDRANQVRDLLKEFELRCIWVTSTGEPQHPLYLKKILKPIPIHEKP
jgi:hypothetical protein